MPENRAGSSLPAWGYKVIGPGVSKFLGVEIPCVPNGFRTSFRNWTRTFLIGGDGWSVVEYRAGESHGRLFEQRVPVMQEWADFLTETMGPVISKLRNSRFCEQHQGPLQGLGTGSRFSVPLLRPRWQTLVGVPKFLPGACSEKAFSWARTEPTAGCGSQKPRP